MTMNLLNGDGSSIGRRELLVAGAACLLPTARAHAAGDPRAFARELAAIEQRCGGRLGVCVRDTADGSLFAHRADERFPMASTFKLLLAAAVLARVDQGREQLARRIPVRAEDLLEYAPATRPHAGGEPMTVAQLCEAAVALSEAFGPLDVLVNNAGVLANFNITEADEDNVRSLYEANVFSAYFCAREAVRRMAKSRGGRGGSIVNMSSVAARLGGLGGGSAYAGSKGAMDSFNLALAKEVGKEGIRVNAIRPGLISTEIHNVHGGIAQMQEMAKTAVPMGRAGSAREVAEAVLWLTTEQASYVHGAVLDVAGGR